MVVAVKDQLARNDTPLEGQPDSDVEFCWESCDGGRNTPSRFAGQPGKCCDVEYAPVAVKDHASSRLEPEKCQAVNPYNAPVDLQVVEVVR